jgi:hypothetical protein
MAEPITPTVDELNEPIPAPQKIVFSDDQKQRINEIVAESSRRAGSEARLEAARLKTELEALQRTQTPPASEAASVELRTVKAELESVRREQLESKLHSELLAAVSTEPFYDVKLAADLLKQSAKIIDGKVVFCGPDGQTRLGADYNPLTPAEAARELASQRPWFVRGRVMGGSGSLPSQGAPVNTTKLEDLFGPHSDSGKANALAMRDKPTYEKLKRLARQKGLR